jgi:glyoxylase-like metal-dependent hydrolase (beta-lactamase superfamily II)
MTGPHPAGPPTPPTHPTMTAPPMVEVGPGVFVLRYPVLDVNCTLIVGTSVALVVDTLSTTAQADHLVAAVRAVTDAPLAVVNTHAHFDHCFGNIVFAQDTPGLPIWAHPSTVELLRDHPTRLHRAAYDEALLLDPALAPDVAATPLLAPDRVVEQQVTVDIGGREVHLHHLGRGHTEGDVVVWIPDAGVLVAGDLVEEGNPPSFSDSYPLDWPETLGALRRLAEPGSLLAPVTAPAEDPHGTVDAPAVTVVPGHGGLVDLDFVAAQQAQLARLEWLIRDGHRDNASPEEVAAVAPFGLDTALVAVQRGYAALDGRL